MKPVKLFCQMRELKVPANMRLSNQPLLRQLGVHEKKNIQQRKSIFIMHQVILAFKMEKRRGGKGYSVLIHNFEDVISSLAEEVDVLLYLKAPTMSQGRRKQEILSSVNKSFLRKCK